MHIYTCIYTKPVRKPKIRLRNGFMIKIESKPTQKLQNRNVQFSNQIDKTETHFKFCIKSIKLLFNFAELV